MNGTQFSEGILGLDCVLPDGRQARHVLADCLRQFAENENFRIASIMHDVAIILDSGSRVPIEVIREIGEKRLTEIKLSLRNVGDNGKVKAFRKSVDDLEVGIRKQGLPIPIHPYAKEED